jgi:hypothetical protein
MAAAEAPSSEPELHGGRRQSASDSEILKSGIWHRASGIFQSAGFSNGGFQVTDDRFQDSQIDASGDETNGS